MSFSSPYFYPEANATDNSSDVLSAVSNIQSALDALSSRLPESRTSNLDNVATAESVWLYTERTLTNRTGFSLSGAQISTIVDAVWNAATRSLTEAVSTNTNISSTDKNSIAAITKALLDTRLDDIYNIAETASLPVTSDEISIDSTANQAVYTKDGVERLRYNLFGENDIPSVTNVRKQVKQ